MKDHRASQLFLIAGWSAYASAVVGALGVVFLAALYVGLFTSNMGLQKFGILNDICIIIQYLLALSVVVALHRIVAVHSPRLSTAAMLMGICGIIVVVVFQVLLVVGLMTFRNQVAFASAGLLVIGGWILIIGYQLQATGKLRKVLLVAILGFLYFGYPVWAIAVGRLLLSNKLAVSGQSPSMRGEIA